LTIFVGTTANGSSRWLMLPGGIQFQPSEFAKLSGILLVAQAIVSKPSMRHWHTLFSLGLLGLIVVLVLKQPNVSMVLLLGLTSAAMAFVSSGLSSWFYVMGLPLVGGFLWNKIQHTDYLSKRLIGWLNPWGDPQGTGYNLIQSWYAIGNGGILGRGWGQSLQKLNALPFPHTDFIYSIVCEELGLLGSLAMVTLFGIIAWRGIHIALTCRDRYGQILAFGITFSIVIQALLNMSVAVGLLPVTGVTLPLVSYGGTSILVTLLMLGVLMHCSRLTRKSF
ncbi:MAG: FtsW/RodA/SpoVE family cell cycle protein, partial [Vampirovibrionales bacterium]|nr:FtsW/RodA/SpoVE family cell cycle protein [Vampirovibrionales bacterium]